MKSIYGRSTKIQYIYKLQELIIFHNYKVVTLTISAIVWAFKIVQIHNIIYPKKNNGRVDILNRKSYHIEIRKIFIHSILKVKKILLLANKYKLNITIYIMRDN